MSNRSRENTIKIGQGDPRTNGKWIWKHGIENQLKVIGRGTEGVVYQVRKGSSNGTKYAAKIISVSPQNRQKQSDIIKELNILKQLPNIRIFCIPEVVHLLEYEVISIAKKANCNLQYYCHKYGIDKDLGNLPFEKMRFIAWQIIGGLSILHEHHVFHRDLKPDNLLVAGKTTDNMPVVQITDFGISIFCQDKEEEKYQSRTGATAWVHQLIVISSYMNGCSAPIKYIDVEIWGFAMTMFSLFVGVKCFVKLAEAKLVKQNDPYSYFGEIGNKLQEFMGQMKDRNSAINMSNNLWWYKILEFLSGSGNAEQHFLEKMKSSMDDNYNKSNNVKIEQKDNYQREQKGMFNLLPSIGNNNNKIKLESLYNNKVNQYIQTELPATNNTTFWQNVNLRRIFTRDSNNKNTKYMMEPLREALGNEMISHEHWYSNIFNVTSNILSGIGNLSLSVTKPQQLSQQQLNTNPFTFNYSQSHVGIPNHSKPKQMRFSPLK